MKYARILILVVLACALDPTAFRLALSETSQAANIHPATLFVENVALGKPVSVTTNGANENHDCAGLSPADISDGSLEYKPSSWCEEDGVVGYVNDNYNELMRITITIDLQGLYRVSRIRYNMGDVQRAETWNADTMITPFGTSGTNPGSPYRGAWTEHTGDTVLSSVTVVLEKTRVSWETDWLFVGEIEVYGVITSVSTISGRVTDASGHGIPGVTVWAGFPRNTTTDASGNYTFTDLPAGTYIIRPAKEGYSFFVPTSIAVTLPPSPAKQDFTGHPCVAPSGLDVCALQAGDIILTASPNTGSCGNEYRFLFNIGGTYFTHTGLYLGQVAAASGSDPTDVRPRIAQAQNPYVASDEQVHETWLTDTAFWTGNCLMDWVVVRPAVSADVRNGAIQWARAKAEESGVLFDILATKWDQKRFYCSKFAWMAYRDGAPGGPDLEADRGIGADIPGIFFRQYWVTPDDLYYSSPVIQEKKVSLEQRLRRGFFWIWSPAHLTLVDPTGRRTGYDSSTGGAVYEIPDSAYVALPDAQVESVTAPGVDSRWQIIVTGYATGNYILESGYANQGTRVQIVAGSTFVGKTETYPVADPEYVQYLPVVWASR